MFLLDTNYFFSVSEDKSYMLGLLNSKVITYWINSKDTPIGSGGAYRHYKYNLENLCLPKLSHSQKSHLMELVDKRLDGATSVESEIDRIVYECYGLAKEEIQYIEDFVR